ncbi:MAG TPA: hypothetical protein VFU21_16630 [Kofleriaceae bacterium]|nr:hypothetical protein [Kofleriaceae bacterium]
MKDERLRELVRLSHEADAPPGFPATVRAARAATAAAPPRRARVLVPAAAALAAAALALVAWLSARDPAPAPPALVAPSLEVPGPFDELPSPFPGLAVADLIEDPW